VPSSRAEVARSLRVAEPLDVRGVLLVPVVRVRVEGGREFGCAFVRAAAELRAVVVDEGGRRRALGPDGEALSLEDLLEEVPGLEDALRRAHHARR
jgi:hypothetical protein